MNKKITALFIIISVLMLIFVACTEMDPLGIANGVPEGFDPLVVPVTGISLDPTSASIEVGGTRELVSTVTPDDATNKDTTWFSSDESIATVGDNGLVTGISAGTATITVKSDTDDTIFAECVVTVTAPVDNDWLYFAMEGSNTSGGDSDIYKIKSDGSESSGSGSFVFKETTNGTPRVIELDPIRRKIYILTSTVQGNNNDYIYEYDLDGGNPKELAVNNSEGTIKNMTVDYVNGFLYYTVDIDGSDDDGIRKINLDGVPQDTLVYNYNSPDFYYLSTDYKETVSLFYFWKDEGTAGDGYIYKVTGPLKSNRSVITTISDTEDTPGGLCYSSVSEKFYYYHGSYIYDNTGYSFDTGAYIIWGDVSIDQSERIFFYEDDNSDDDNDGPYILRSMKNDGSDGIVVLDDAGKRIGAFDILSK